MNNFKHETETLLTANNEIQEEIIKEESKKENINQERIKKLLSKMVTNVLSINELQNLREEELVNTKHEEIRILKLSNEAYTKRMQELPSVDHMKQLQELMLLNLERIKKLQRETVQ